MTLDPQYIIRQCNAKVAISNLEDDEIDSIATTILFHAHSYLNNNSRHPEAKVVEIQRKLRRFDSHGESSVELIDRIRK